MIKLDDLQGGALSEKINYELQAIFNNIKDPNTEQTKTRTLTISLKFKPNKKGDMVELTPALKTTLAPATTEPTTIIVERNFETGKVVAKEYNGQIEGQVNMEELENELKNDAALKEAAKEGKEKVIDLLAK